MIDLTESEVDWVGRTALARGFCGLQNSPRVRDWGPVCSETFTDTSHMPSLSQCSNKPCVLSCVSASCGSVTAWGALHALNPHFILWNAEHRSVQLWSPGSKQFWCNCLFEGTLAQSVHPAGEETEAQEGGWWLPRRRNRTPDVLTSRVFSAAPSSPSETRQTAAGSCPVSTNGSPHSAMLLLLHPRSRLNLTKGVLVNSSRCLLQRVVLKVKCLDS